MTAKPYSAEFNAELSLHIIKIHLSRGGNFGNFNCSELLSVHMYASLAPVFLTIGAQ